MPGPRSFSGLAVVPGIRLWWSVGGSGTVAVMDLAGGERERVVGFWGELGLPGLIDVHTHFMPERVLAKVWAYFDAAGPLLGRPWPIAYRQEEDERLATLRGFGVRAFTSMVYLHKPGMAAWLNGWAAEFAARTPDCLRTATFYPEPEAAGYVGEALAGGVRVFKAHVQVGAYDPADRLLDPVWGAIAEAGVPVVTHCGSGPAPGAFTGPGPIGKVLARHPAAAADRRAPADAGVHGVPRPGRAVPRRAPRHDDGVHRLHRGVRPASRARSGRGSERSGTAYSSAAISPTSRTATTTPWTSSPGSTRTRRGCARSVTTTPPGCGGSGGPTPRREGAGAGDC